MIDEFLYKPLEDKTISKIQRFKINNKDLIDRLDIFSEEFNTIGKKLIS